MQPGSSPAPSGVLCNTALVGFTTTAVEPPSIRTSARPLTNKAKPSRPDIGQRSDTSGERSALPVVRWWDTWPAVDRHADRRPAEWLDGLTRGLDGDTLLVADINWQLDNGLDYYARHVRP